MAKDGANLGKSLAAGPDISGKRCEYCKRPISLASPFTMIQDKIQEINPDQPAKYIHLDCVMRRVDIPVRPWRVRDRSVRALYEAR